VLKEKNKMVTDGWEVFRRHMIPVQALERGGQQRKGRSKLCIHHVYETLNAL